MGKKSFHPDRVLDYFREEWFPLTLVTITGLIYNFGLLAGPWFEGKMAACLMNVLQGKADFHDMLTLVAGYVAAISVVQIARYFKRFYVRRFANNVNRHMKHILYSSLIGKSRAALEQEGVGNVITKAISDVDDCVEGMRKFTTEIFDTGVAMIGYIGMLLAYDWRLTLLCMIFPPVSYILAEHMKGIVQKTGANFKKENGALSAATLDRVSNALTYRVYGCEEQRNTAYEKNLTDYEKSAVTANIWSTALPPLYQVISMVSVLFILYFGGRNVMHLGWKEWGIAAFTTFLSCYSKLSVKSSKCAKLFNSVHKAQVSWKRIKPYMEEEKEDTPIHAEAPAKLNVSQLSFAYPTGGYIYQDLNLDAKPGQIIGVTGPVACGKSTLGKTFLPEYPYEGSIRFDGQELRDLPEDNRRGIVDYLGHDPEVQSCSIEENILMGEKDDVWTYLKLVCLDQEVSEMEEKEKTLIGSSGIRLSGGQQQRLALARTLKYKKPVIILDDPFSALDRSTEEQIFENLKKAAADSIVILISHRLYLFPQCDQIIWMNQGKTLTGTHESLLKTVPLYHDLYYSENPEKTGSAYDFDIRNKEKTSNIENSSANTGGNDPSSSQNNHKHGDTDTGNLSPNPSAIIILQSLAGHILLTCGVAVSVIGAVVVSLLPPLLLAHMVDTLTGGKMFPFHQVLLYFLLIALTGILESSRESLLTILGQKITHALRTHMSQKLNRLPADTLNKEEPGVIVSRFVGDVDTVESLFTSGIISMFADACKIISIFVIILMKNAGLALVLALVLPFIFLYTRYVQKRMLAANLSNRTAISRVTNHVPETIRCIRTIHSLGLEKHMKETYAGYIQDSYRAIEKTNFYDAIYSPIILILNAFVVALVMLFSASGNTFVLNFFGMSVGTAVAVINYISQIFGPIESLGMEIQTIQSAIAGLHRMNEYLNQEEKWDTLTPEEYQTKCSKCRIDETRTSHFRTAGSTQNKVLFDVELNNVTFGYDASSPILKGLSFSVNTGEQVTLAGRTGAGKSTIFKLLLGMYQVQSGSIKVKGIEACQIPDQEKRHLFGYVEQSFHAIPGSIRDQITLNDPSITEEMVEKAAALTGLDTVINQMDQRYHTPCTPEIFSQGQWQLLSIARAVAGDPQILLLDEITANLDADTEAHVLQAISNVSANRTVISISHRIYQHTGGRLITI